MIQPIHEREHKIVYSLCELEAALFEFQVATISDGVVSWQTTARDGPSSFMRYFNTSEDSDWPLIVYKGHLISSHTWRKRFR